MISFTSLLQSAPNLNKLLAKLAQLEQLNRFIAKYFEATEPNLGKQCRVANLREGILILSTTGPAWKHKLRFATSDLLSALRANPQWSSLKSIEVRIDYIP